MIHPSKEQLSWDEEKMDYEALIVFLNANHFYPNKTIVVKKNAEVVDGLWLEANRHKDMEKEKVARLNEILADKFFVANFLPTLQEIHITKKK